MECEECKYYCYDPEFDEMVCNQPTCCEIDKEILDWEQIPENMNKDDTYY